MHIPPEFTSEVFHSIITGLASVMCGVFVFFIKSLIEKLQKWDVIMHKMQLKMAVMATRLENIEKELERQKHDDHK